MRIIKKDAFENGAHDNQTWSGAEVPEGWAIIPDDMELPASYPFVDITVDGGVVTAMTEREVPEADDTPQIIAAKKAQLAAEDYKIIKCFEAYMCGEDLPYDLTDLHADRQILRAQINALEGNSGDAE